jgi:hypothetical protein
LALAWAAACSQTQDNGDGGAPGDGGRDGSGGDGAAPGDSGSNVPLQLMPSKTYTGIDGTHTFRVPVAVYGGGKTPTLTASDPSMVTIAPTALTQPQGDDGVYFMVTAVKSGTVTLTASAGGGTAQGTLTISAYTADEWNTGNDRFNVDAGAVDGGSQPLCAQCHAGAAAIDNSPATLASATDPEVATIITQGIKPGPTPITGVPGGHRWSVTPTQAQGLTVYLRALKPNGFTN